MSTVEVKGILLENVAPIIDQVIEFREGVNIIYGKNGVGKSRILNAICHSANPIGKSPGGFSLTYQFQKRDFKSRDIFRSPWCQFSRTYPSHYDLMQEIDLTEKHANFRELSSNQGRESLLSNLAFYIFCLNFMWESEDRFHEDLVELCYEIAEQSIFQLVFREASERFEHRCIAPESHLIPKWDALMKDARVLSRQGELGEEKYGFSFWTQLTYFIEDFKSLKFPWQGQDVLTIEETCSFLPPIDLIDETGHDFLKETNQFIFDLLNMSLAEHDPESNIDYLETPSLLIEIDGLYQINPIVIDAASKLSERASMYFKMLMMDAPDLKCSVRDLGEWGTGSPIEWVAEENFRDFFSESVETHELPISSLSNAQRRWAEFAIKLSMINADGNRPLLIVLDEPEAGLHRRAERQLAIGISEITKRFRAKCILATHSPTFLNDKSNNLIHVSREATGNTRIETMSNDFINRLDDYGIDRSDLLQFCKTFLIVEGVHDFWVLDELFHQEFVDSGIEVLALRGLAQLKHLSALDAQFLFRFTTSEILICFDNDETKSVQDIWFRACIAKDAGLNFIKILDELNTLHKLFAKTRDEYKMIHEFCVLAINENSRGRVKFHSLTKGDIIEYFSPQDFTKSKLGQKTFDDFRKEYDLIPKNPKTGTRPSFKAWLTSEIGAEYSERFIRSAVRKCDAIHQDLTDLLNAVCK
jgi:predicted ATP-dependent endonuclease of OLD family